jgi:chromosome partitioning protein
MKVITFVTQKGGTGKSTLAVSLAVAAQEAGHQVYVLDMDPQESAFSWFKRRQSDEPTVDTSSAAVLPVALKTLGKHGYDYVIIDTAGSDTPATAAAIQASDLCLLPARPSLLDIEASKPTVASLLKLNRPFAFVLNQCPPGRNMRITDAGRALNTMGHLAEPAFVTRADHVDAVGLGQGVTERDPDGKAAQEIRQLYVWIEKRLVGANSRAA